jgi:hypothetical protein
MHNSPVTTITCDILDLLCCLEGCGSEQLQHYFSVVSSGMAEET